MRVSVLILGALVLILGTGCLSVQDREYVMRARQEAMLEADRLKDQMEALKNDMALAIEALKEKRIPIAEGAALLDRYRILEEQISEAIDVNRERLEKINEIGQKGGWSTWLDILLTIAGGGGLGAAATRLLRGASSRPYKEKLHELAGN
jgi:hypothetical protein